MKFFSALKQLPNDMVKDILSREYNDLVDECIRLKSESVVLALKAYVKKHNDFVDGGYEVIDVIDGFLGDELQIEGFIEYIETCGSIEDFIKKEQHICSDCGASVLGDYSEHKCAKNDEEYEPEFHGVHV